jgi:Uma2 family endonuclease
MLAPRGNAMASVRTFVEGLAEGGVSRRPWTRAEFERAAELGLFGPEERLELIAGEVVSKVPPQKSPHATAIRAVEEALRTAFRRGFDVRVQLPLALGPDHEPEPDVCVVRGSFRDYRHEHPTSAVLVVEVSDTTLAFDRFKAGLYAQAGIPEYWIVNLKDNCLEVQRDPEAAAAEPFGHRYRTVTRVPCDENMAVHGTSISVADLLP